MNKTQTFNYNKKDGLALSDIESVIANKRKDYSFMRIDVKSSVDNSDLKKKSQQYSNREKETRSFSRLDKSKLKNKKDDNL